MQLNNEVLRSNMLNKKSKETQNISKRIKGGKKMSYQIKIPSYICGGEGCIENVAAIIEKEHAKKIIVFTDKGIRLTGLLDRSEERRVGKECRL